MKAGLARHIAACVLALTCSTGALAQSENLDGLSRIENRGDLLGWEAVGRVELPLGYCTGTLIASDLVLTAAHCIHDSETGEQVRPEFVRFRAGYGNGSDIAVRKVRKVAVPEGYEARSADRLRPDMIQKDVALLLLDDPISRVLAIPFSLHSDPSKGETVSVVSYGRGRDDTLSWQRECHVVDRFPGGLMSFDCNVTFGSSGAPVLARDGSRKRIISLVSAGGRNGDGPVGYGMYLPDVVADLRRQLRREVQQMPVTSGWRSISAGERRQVTDMRPAAPRNGNSTGAKFVRP